MQGFKNTIKAQGIDVDGLLWHVVRSRMHDTHAGDEPIVRAAAEHIRAAIKLSRGKDERASAATRELEIHGDVVEIVGRAVGDRKIERFGRAINDALRARHEREVSERTAARRANQDRAREARAETDAGVRECRTCGLSLCLGC
jgi:hypothetical protein